MSLSSPIKIHKLTGRNELDSVIVFWGTNLEIPNPTELFNEFILPESNKKDAKYKPIINLFSEDDLTKIITNNIPVTFTNQAIHIDDNIGTIKLKVFHAIGKQSSMDEIYLFCLKSEQLNSISLYQTLTQNDRVPLNKVRLNQMLYNIYKPDGTPFVFDIPSKERYTFDDILKLNLSKEEHLVAKALGQKFVFFTEYPFVVDPFLVTEYDHLLERSRKELTSLNSNLLLESELINNNTLYMCLAEDVFKTMETKKLSVDYASKIYFPFLYKSSIDSMDKLLANREKLVRLTDDKLTKNTQRIFENINMFYDVYNNQKPSDKFSQIMNKTGITGIKVVMYPKYKIKIPIDVIFKLLHANTDYPVIKFNPETRQENIYRLYTDKLTINGNKIPAIINEETYKDRPIFKLIKQMGTKKSVSIYTVVVYQIDNTYEPSKNENEFHMVCEFDEDGNIMIYSFKPFIKPVIIGDIHDPTFTHMNHIIELAVNQLIEQIKPFFEQSGLEIPLFKSIQDSNIEIRNISYQMVYSVKDPKKLDLDNYTGCLSSIFSIENSNLTQNRGKNNDRGAILRFKRVSNFTVLDSQVAFIIEKIDQGLRQNEIIAELQSNYDDLNEEQAMDVFQKTIRDLELTRGSKRRRSIMIKVNPGFKTNMYTQSKLLGSKNTEFVVDVSGINDLYYLHTFPMYIDTFVRITQDVTSTNIDKSVVKKMCSGEQIEELVFDEITAQTEQPVASNQIPDISNDDVYYSSSSDSASIKSHDSLLDMLGFEEENLEDEGLGLGSGLGSGLDVTENADLKGGEPSSSEDESKPPLQIGKKIQTKIALEKDPLPNANVNNVIGQKLKYPNPFSKRIEDKMPHLFVKSKDDKIDLYTRMCPFSLAARRQPIILTQKEKEELVNDHPDHYLDESGNVKESEFIEYGTDPADKSKKFFFTCPRYWCLLTNTMVTKEDIMAGKCGPKPAKLEDAIIPQKADKVPKDKYVYEFYKEDAPDNYPGFHKENLPDGSCIPCCYSKWSTTEMKKRRNTCQGKVEEQVLDAISKTIAKSKTKLKKAEKLAAKSMSKSKSPTIKNPQEVVEQGQEQVAEDQDQLAEDQEQVAQEQEQGQEQEDSSNTEEESEIVRGVKGLEGYIKGPENFPLRFEQWGWLPIIVQKFLNESNADCQISKTNMNLKPNHTCLLRYGVENNSKQSFIACIAASMFYLFEEDEHNKNNKPSFKNPYQNIPTIEEMKQIIIDAIDIDKFMTYQNGDLISSFANPVDTEKQVKPKYIHKLKATEAQVLAEAEAEAEAEESDDDETKKFVKGEKITCNYHGLDKTFRGKIAAVNRNNTYDIVYEKIHVNIDDYQDSELYKKIQDKISIDQGNNTSEMKQKKLYRIKPSIQDDEDKTQIYEDYENEREEYDFLIKVAESFENFKRFLLDKTIYIDYTYLWDIICMPNPKLFRQGLNLIVLEIPEDDISNNIELACPTNQYSDHIYDGRKKSIFLIKREKRKKGSKWFEPIYAYYNRISKSTKPKITSAFRERDIDLNKKLPSSLKSVFTKIIKPTLEQKCKPLSQPSRPFEYRFKTAPILDTLIDKLAERKYKIFDQVLNFQGKVIGLRVTSPTKKTGFVPCYPSSLNKKYEYVFMTDEIWHSYEDTLSFLKEYYKYKEPKDITKVQCYDDRYFCKVADSDEDGTIIVGFLTNTNQFIQINKPQTLNLIEDNIHTISSNDTLTADINTQVSNRVDNRRVDFIKRIQLETNFYNIFRNTIRILFNDYSNSAKREEIQKECNSKTLLYRTKLTTVVEKLKELVNDSIEFVEFFDYKNLNENELQNCITNKMDTCVTNTNSICKLSTNGDKCIITFPALNLVTKKSNDEYYYGRMADELIRYNRIKSFIFKPQAYLSFGPVKYNLQDNEIILLENMLTQDYFSSLIPADINIYARNNTYDTTEPNMSDKYKNNYNSPITMDSLMNPYIGKECKKSEPLNISITLLRDRFPNCKEIVYKDSPFCAFYVIIDLVKKIKQMDITVSQIKDDLIEEYNRLIVIQDDENERLHKDNLVRKHNIFALLKAEKQYDTIKLISEEITYDQMIIQYGFRLVNFDMWILLNRYEIPSILLSLAEKKLQETNRKQNEFVCYRTPDKDDDKYVFIVVPSMYQRDSEHFPEYKILVNDSGNELISVTNLTETGTEDKKYKTLIKYAISQYSTIEDFLDNKFIKETTGEIKEMNELKKSQLRDAKANVEFVLPAEPDISVAKPKPANKSRKGGNKNRSQMTKKRRS
jgi:hypothetical protein